MRRSDNGLWGLPGGYVEIGETVAQAALREVEEETGFAIELGRLIGVYSDPARQVIAYSESDRIQAVNLCFEARALSEGVSTTPEETLESGFFSHDALPEPFVPIHDIRIADAIAGGREAWVR
jgi:ADP-ribose pyrophosphatase YjhB (NUDIX family)